MLYKPSDYYPCVSSPGLTFFQSIIILIQTRSYYAAIAQIQKDKDSPYLIEFMVEDLLCQALNQAYILQGIQGSILFIGCWRSIRPDVGWLVKQVKNYKSSNFTFPTFNICKIWLTESFFSSLEGVECCKKIM